MRAAKDLGDRGGVFGRLWKIKLRLQFTGWLQYVPVALVAVVLLLVAAVGRLIGAAPIALFWTPLSLGGLSLALFAFEVVTIKLGFRPAEPLPRPLDGLDAFDLMRARRSCRSFQRRDLTDAHRQAILASVRANTSPDVLIGDRPIRFEFITAPLTVWPVVGAHEFLVAIGPRAYDRTAIVDVGRSLQRVVLDATRLGVATCWIGPGADHASILRHLGDRIDLETDHIVCVCALGYRSRYVPTIVRLMTRSMRWRLPLASLFFADAELREPLAVTAPPFAAFGRCFEACRWSPSSYNGQTTRAVGAKVGQGVRMDFYASTTSRFYAPVALGIWCANWETGCGALGIAGQFVDVPAVVRGTRIPHAVPRYDVSWMSGGSVANRAVAARLPMRAPARARSQPAR